MNLNLSYLRKNTLSGILGVYNPCISFWCMNGRGLCFYAILIYKYLLILLILHQNCFYLGDISSKTP